MFLSCVLLLLLALLALVLLFFHYLPLFLNLRASIPSGSFGWPLAGETLSFLTPHASNSLGAFLEQHISRYMHLYMIMMNFVVMFLGLKLNFFGIFGCNIEWKVWEGVQDSFVLHSNGGIL